MDEQSYNNPESEIDGNFENLGQHDIDNNQELFKWD